MRKTGCNTNMKDHRKIGVKNTSFQSITLMMCLSFELKQTSIFPFDVSHPTKLAGLSCALLIKNQAEI